MQACWKAMSKPRELEPELIEALKQMSETTKQMKKVRLRNTRLVKKMLNY